MNPILRSDPVRQVGQLWDDTGLGVHVSAKYPNQIRKAFVSITEESTVSRHDIIRTPLIACQISFGRTQTDKGRTQRYRDAVSRRSLDDIIHMRPVIGVLLGEIRAVKWRVSVIILRCI